MTVHNIIPYIRYAAKTKLVVLSAFTVLSLGLLGFVNALPQSANAASGLPVHDPSNIVDGGISSPSDLVAKYNARNPSDIQTIYNAFGLQASDLSNFSSHAVTGTLKKDGTLTVNGKIIADNAQAIGRKGPQDGYKQTTAMTIAGKTYYTTPLSYILGFYNMTSTNAYVLMDNDHVTFVAMQDCGNGVKVTQPDHKCNMLHSTKVNDTTYNFTTDVSATNGATLSKVVYDFGDGSATVTETSASKVVTHTYAKDGKFTAKVTAYFTYHGQTITVAGEKKCQTDITIPKKESHPPVCSALGIKPLGDNKYEFTVTATPGDETLQSATFTFDDGSTQSVNATAGSNTITTQHQYVAKSITYHPSATLDFNKTTGVTGDTCKQPLEVQQQECKPGIPVGDTRCQTQECKPGIPVGDSRCETPKELPSTGPADIVGSGLGIGSVVAAGSYYVRTRRDLLSTIFKR